VSNAPYFPNLIVEGNTYEFTHLNAFHMSFYSMNAKKDLRLYVVFTNHCFTISYIGGMPTNGMPIIDVNTPRPRLFCPIRYQLSKDLPDIINKMNNGKVKVHETATRRNFVHSIKIESPSGPYHLFIDIKKGTEKDRDHHDIKVVIESAYHQDEEPPKLLGKIGFHILCTNKYLKKKTSTQR
jgi:hypothetical protein